VTNPPWPARLIAELDASDARASAIARGLTVDQLNWRRDPTEWSVGQCLDHLRAASEEYIPPITAALSGRPTAIVQEITPGWFARWFIRAYIEPSPTTRKARAPGKIVPVAQVDATILERFLAANQALSAVIERASRLDVNRIRFKNPFVDPVRFTVGAGFEILSRHQRRHLLQAERIRNAPEFPRS
jgi:DinB superfamily